MLDSNNKTSNFFLETLPHLVSDRINVMSLARVTRYEKKRHICSVKLLPMKDGQSVAPLTEVIVPASIWQIDKFMKAKSDKYQTMKVGSIVNVGFFDTEIDNYQGKRNFKVESHRRHSLNDAIILGVVKP